MSIPQVNQKTVSRLAGCKKYLIAYADARSGSEGQRLLQALLSVTGQYNAEYFFSVEPLKKRFKQLHRYDEQHVYVLLADSRERLEQLHSLGILLEDRKIVLILPNNTKETYALGFRMYPRFVTLMPGAYHDLCAVVGEMMRPRKR